MAPNIVLAPNMTQNAERKHRTQDTNTAPIRPHVRSLKINCSIGTDLKCSDKQLVIFYVLQD